LHKPICFDAYGKKDKELMAKQKKEFVENAVVKNIERRLLQKF